MQRKKKTKWRSFSRNEALLLSIILLLMSRTRVKKKVTFILTRSSILRRRANEMESVFMTGLSCSVVNLKKREARNGLLVLGLLSPELKGKEMVNDPTTGLLDILLCT